MTLSKRFILFTVLLIAACLAAACDPLAPFPTSTAVVIIVTPENSPTPLATDTPAATPTPTLTPEPTPTPTPTELPCLADGGQVLSFDEFRSTTAGENIPYRVYIPPCFLETGKRYPYVILLHGLQQNMTEWETIGVVSALEQGMRLGALGPMILVMPSLGRIGTLDQFAPNASYEQFIIDELITAIERDFCTWNDREYRAIGGISRGGFWAYSIAMRHPELFGRVGGHSAYLDAQNAPNTVRPLDLAMNDAFLSQADLNMYLDNAAADPAGATIELFSSRLSARGIPHTYIIHPSGGHDEAYWSSHISEYLTFYGQDWPRTAAELPSCLEPSP